ncbi:aldo/keto reductase, partial [Streptomyces sp. TRM76130]|nr:aldo/keto reductase [Streptomyces sp. TRM76130]
AQLDDLPAGVGMAPDDDVLDRMNEIVAPGTDLGALDIASVSPSPAKPGLRRRPPRDRSAT